jgi:hypothetical protein
VGDARLLGELAHGASCRRRHQDAKPAGRIGLGEQPRGERLARPRQRLDSLHPVTARGQATDHPGLFRARREGRGREHRVDEGSIDDAGAFAASSLSAGHDRLLMGQEIARRKPPAAGVGRVRLRRPKKQQE